MLQRNDNSVLSSTSPILIFDLEFFAGFRAQE